jgi:hypothetical protein
MYSGTTPPEPNAILDFWKRVDDMHRIFFPHRCPICRIDTRFFGCFCFYRDSDGGACD